MGSDFLLTHWYGDRPSSEVEDELVTRLVAALPATLPELIEQVWDGEIEESSRSLDVHIGRLRGKLAEAGECGVRIETVPAVGYRLDEA